MKYIKNLWKKALTIDGRCSRRTFWYTVMYNILLELSVTGTGLLIYLVANNQNQDIISYIGMGIFFIGLVYDSLSNVAYASMAVRRLHDRNMRGFFLLLLIFPAVQIFVIAMLLLKSKDAGNRWGTCSD